MPALPSLASSSRLWRVWGALTALLYPDDRIRDVLQVLMHNDAAGLQAHCAARRESGVAWHTGRYAITQLLLTNGRIVLRNIQGFRQIMST